MASNDTVRLQETDLRDFNRLLAERVMGWKWDLCDRYDTPVYRTPEGRSVPEDKWIPTSDWGCASQLIAKAMEFTEKNECPIIYIDQDRKEWLEGSEPMMQAAGTVQFTIQRDVSGKWRAGFTRAEDYGGQTWCLSAQSQEAPEAIANVIAWLYRIKV